MPEGKGLPSRSPISLQKFTEGSNLLVKNGSERGLGQEGKRTPAGSPCKPLGNFVLGAVKLQSHHRPHEIFDSAGRKSYRKSQQTGQPALTNDQLMPHFYYPKYIIWYAMESGKSGRECLRFHSVRCSKRRISLRPYSLYPRKSLLIAVSNSDSLRKAIPRVSCSSSIYKLRYS